jgi:hypothetical protein
MAMLRAAWVLLTLSMGLGAVACSAEGLAPMEVEDDGDSDEPASTKEVKAAPTTTKPSTPTQTVAQTDDAGAADAAPAKPPVPVETPTEKVSISSPSKIFDSAGPWQDKRPAVRANERHAEPVNGKHCMGCHGQGGTAPRFAFAGTIYEGEDFAGNGRPSTRNKPAPGAQMRIVGKDGLVFNTFADDDGNFYFRTDTELKLPAFSGARRNGFSAAGQLNGISCFDCHDAKSSPGRLWIR